MKNIHNITINLANGEEKYYYYNTSFDCLEKHSSRGIERQFALSRVPVDLFRLQQFLGFDINLDDVFVDTYDFRSDTYWLMTEDTDPENLVKLYQVLLDKFALSLETFLHWAGYLNELKINSLQECATKKCIACIRVPLQSKKLKIYARPFRHHSFKIAKKVHDRLHEIFGTESKTLKQQLDTGGVSYDFSDGRIVLFTQNDSIRLLR